MTEHHRTVRRARRLTWTCHILIAVLSIALWARRHPWITRAVLITIAIGATGQDLAVMRQFGWL